MGISDRIHDTVENWTDEWKNRLRGWMASWVQDGVLDLLDGIEPEALDAMQSTMDRIRDDPNTPDEIKNLINKITTPGQPIPLLVLIPLAVIIFLPMLFALSEPLARIFMYQQDKLLHSARLDPDHAIRALWREIITNEHLMNELKDQGWSDDNIEYLKEVTKFYPAPQDLITWEAKEVFEPDMIAKYGLADEFENLDLSLFAKAGVSEEQAKNYWIAHWEHASFNQVVEMLHRGLLTEDDMWEWFRVVEIPPYWRGKLIGVSWNVPTRVDVRRFWDMRTIDESRLREVYTALGYHGKDLDDYVLWTKVYVAFPDMMARWTNGWITEDDVRDELVGMGMPSHRVTEFIQQKKKNVDATQAEEGKALIKSEIYKAVKGEFISREQGIEFLMDMNYSRATAELLLDINVGVLTGSPETYEEFKDLTTKYRIATGRGGEPMPEEIKQLATELVKLNDQVKTLKLAIKEESDKLVPDENLPETATARLTELEVALHKAQAELARVQTDYNIAVAEWKRKG